MTPVSTIQGTSPLVLGLPHTGTDVPAEIWGDLNDNGRALADTDWHIDRLYGDLVENITTVRANFHRYAIDANRDPSGRSLYPGQSTTGLVPLTDFDGLDIWHRAPTPVGIENRRQSMHAPYHQALTLELQRVKNIHGFVVLFDCHSIRSNIPFLFDGTLPDFNIGTNRGATCNTGIERLAEQHCAAATPYSSVLNGRFLGGWTTREYGKPAEGFHAIQMELAQSTYLTAEAAPWAYGAEKASPLRGILRALLIDIQNWKLV